MKISQSRNQTSQNFFPVFSIFSLCCSQIPCLEKMTSKFPVFPVLWPPWQYLCFNISDRRGYAPQLCWHTCIRICASIWQDQQNDPKQCQTFHQPSLQVLCVHHHQEDQKQQCWPPINKQPDPTTGNQVTVHTKEDLMSLYPDCFTHLDKFQNEPVHTDVDPSIPPKKTPYKPVPIHQEATFK